MSKIVKGVGNALGLSGGAKEAERFHQNPAAFEEFYQQALAEMQGVGRDPASMANRQSIEKILGEQLGQLDNNAAGRKQNFMEDMNRGFSADTQSIARARGGTGNMAQAMKMGGGMYDSQARAQSRGLNDLYSQAVQDLGSLQGVQGNLFGQDFQRGTNIANLHTGEQAARRGIQTNNLDNSWNAEQAKNQRFGNTLKGVAQGVGAVASPHTTAGKVFGGGF